MKRELSIYQLFNELIPSLVTLILEGLVLHVKRKQIQGGRKLKKILTDHKD